MTVNRAKISSDLDATERARRSWLRSSPTAAQPSSSSGEEVHDGRTYIVLRNINGPLAVYGVTPTGRVQAVRDDWPASIL